MNKKLHFKSLLLLAAMLFGVSSAWAEEVTDELSQAVTGISGTSYKDFSGIKVNSDAVYAGQCAGDKSSIQLRSNNSNSGVITTTSGGKLKKIVVEWVSDTQDGRTLNIYGSNTAYTAATDLYNTDKQGTLIGTIVKGTSTELVVTGDFTFVGLRSASGAMYLAKVSITWDADASTADLTETEVTINGIQEKLDAGKTLELTATVKDDESQEISGATVTWTSSDETVATIADGVITALKGGQTTITATYAGEEGTYKGSNASFILTVAGAIEDGIFDFSLGQDYGSGLEKSAVAVQSSTWTAGNITMNVTGRNCWFTDNKTLRLYKANNTGGAGTLEFSCPSGKVILKIEFTGKDLNGLADADGKYSGSTWEGSSETVTLAAKDDASTIQIETITVTYGNPPSVQAPESSIPAGAYTEAQSVELTCATAGATIYYTTDGSDPTDASTEYTEAIEVTETTTIKAIAVTSEGTSTIMEVTITLPTQYNSIAELIAAEPKETVILNLTNAQVLAAGSSDMYIKDASGAIDFYNIKLPYTAGQVLNGSVTVTEFKYFNTMPEVSKVGNYNLTAEDGTLAPVEVSSTSDVTLDDYMCQLITVRGTATGDSKIDDLLMKSKFTGITDTNLSHLYAGLDDITVTGIVAPTKSDNVIVATLHPTAISFNITLAKDMVTYCASNKLDFTESGLTVYSAKVENGAAALTELPDNENGLKIVNYGRGFILAGTAGTTYTVPMTTEKVSSPESNELYGISADTEVAYQDGEKFNYILQGGVFKKATGATLKAGKAYLKTAFDVTADAARELKIVFAGEATGIKAIVTDADQNVYDLQGRKVAAPQKGLYIINGKKYIVK